MSVEAEIIKTCDLKIIGFEKHENKDTLGAIICEYKNTGLKCSNGFSKELRKAIWEHTGNYLGKIVEIRHLGETYDKTTESYNLKFPVFKQFGGDKTEPNYD